jgi:hypothetical protein
MSPLQVAFACYLVLAVIAVAILRGDFRIVVLILLGGLAIKTYIGHLKDAGTRLGSRGSTMEADSSEASPETKEE